MFTPRCEVCHGKMIPLERKFCSNECRNVGLAKRVKERYICSIGKQGKLINPSKLICLACSQKFIPLNHAQKFCCRECRVGESRRRLAKRKYDQRQRTKAGP